MTVPPPSPPQAGPSGLALPGTAKRGQIVAHVTAHDGNPVLCIAIAGSAPWVAQAAGQSVESVRCEVADLSDLTFPRLHW